MDTDVVWAFLSTQGLDFAMKVLGAVVAWLIGRWLIGVLKRLTRRALERGRRIDETLAIYITVVVGVALNVLLVLAILDIFGVRTTSFAALLAGAGLAIGTAWGGLLTHFAAGVFLQVLRPYKAGDQVTVGGITGGSVNVREAMDKLREALAKVPNVAQTPRPEVEIVQFTPEGPLLAVRPDAHTSNYWQVYFDTHKAIVDTFTAAGYPVPEMRTAQRAIQAAASSAANAGKA